MEENVKQSKLEIVKHWCITIWEYCSRGVWNDTRSGLIVSVIKTLNLSVSSFLNTDLQSRAAALTYRTLLAIVPALALLFAIGRGFGFHNLLQTQLFNYFPSQKEALQKAFEFVDSYLAQASEGIFVGVGIVFLLWTLISLVGSVEDAFNTVWGIKQGRSIWRKITDYTAIFMILPILMICASGLSLFLSETLQNAITFRFLSPVFPILLEIATFVLTWLFFAGVYMLIPNTKVKFKHAFISGVISGTAFQLLQWLFVSGQLYVSKYNAIYGSFALLPLLMMWIYLVWVITMSGAVLCYSSQNIFKFSYFNNIKEISPNYRRKISIAVMAIIAQQFKSKCPPLTIEDITVKYNIPIRLATDVINDLVEAKLVSRVLIEGSDEIWGLQPAVDTQTLTLGYMLKSIDSCGTSEFVSEFDSEYNHVYAIYYDLFEKSMSNADEILLSDINLNLK